MLRLSSRKVATSTPANAESMSSRSFVEPKVFETDRKLNPHISPVKTKTWQPLSFRGLWQHRNQRWHLRSYATGSLILICVPVSSLIGEYYEHFAHFFHNFFATLIFFFNRMYIFIFHLPVDVLFYLNVLFQLLSSPPLRYLLALYMIMELENNLYISIHYDTLHIKEVY